MTSVLLTSLPAQGHVGPVLAVAADLAARGHRVRVLTGEAFRDRVTGQGVEFLPLPPGAGVPDGDDLTTGLPPGRPGGPRGVGFDLEHVFVARMAAQFEAVEAALAAEAADVVVTELLFLGTYPLLAREHRPRVVLLGISPLPVRGGGTGAYGTGLRPATGPLGRLRNALLRRLLDRVVFASPQRLLVEEFSRLTGRRLEGSLFDLPLLTDAVVQLCPPGLEHPRPDLPVHVRFVGPLPTPVSDLPESPWWGELGEGRPVVHVTQGTHANEDFSHLVVPAVRALAGRSVLVVLSAGGRPVQDLRDALGTVPGNVRLAGFLDHRRLLPRVHALVTNGGYGTVNLALAHGVPLVVSGRTEDKAEVGARVAWSGAGIDLRTETPRPRAISDAVGRVLFEPGYRAAAARLRAEIDVAGGFDAIDDLVRSA